MTRDSTSSKALGSVDCAKTVTLQKAKIAIHFAIKLLPAVNLVEKTTFREMGCMSLLPAPENFVNGKEFDLREGRAAVAQDRFVARAEIMLCGELLAGVGVEELQVLLCDFCRAAALRHAVHDR